MNRNSTFYGFVSSNSIFSTRGLFSFLDIKEYLVVPVDLTQSLNALILGADFKDCSGSAQFQLA